MTTVDQEAGGVASFDGEEPETNTQDTGEETSDHNAVLGTTKVDLGQEIQGVKEQLGALMETFQRGLPQATPATIKAPLSKEEIDRALAANPRQGLEMLVESLVENRVGQLTAEQKKGQWDQQAERDFPQIKTDREFQRAVSEKMRALQNNGEYGQNSPMLVYRAAQIAAFERGQREQKSQSTRQAPAPMSGDAPRSTPAGGTKKPASSDHLYQSMLKTFGLKDSDRLRAAHTANLKRLGGK